MVFQVSGLGPGDGRNGIRASSGGALGAETESAEANTWLFETAATEIPSGAVPGEPAVPKPNSSRSFPAEMTGTSPAAATFLIVSTIASLAGSDSGPSPEKLITSIPSPT